MASVFTRSSSAGSHICGEAKDDRPILGYGALVHRAWTCDGLTAHHAHRLAADSQRRFAAEWEILYTIALREPPSRSPAVSGGGGAGTHMKRVRAQWRETCSPVDSL